MATTDRSGSGPDPHGHAETGDVPSGEPAGPAEAAGPAPDEDPAADVGPARDAAIETEPAAVRDADTNATPAADPGPDVPDAEAAPAAARRRPAGPLWAKICLAVGIVLMLVSAATGVAIKELSRRYEGSVTRDTLLGAEARQARAGQAISLTGPLNFLLIGSDFKPRAAQEGQRSDTIIVVHVPRSMDRAYLISIPRDLLVDIPPYPPTAFRGARTKINASFLHGGGDRGGAQLLASTLSRLLGVRFDGAAIINFEGFQRAVNVLGGVYLCVDRRVESNHMGYDGAGRLLQLWADEEGRLQGLPPDGHPVVYEPGCRRMTGQLALDYTRIRYGLPGGDYDRQRHQQAFLKSVLAEAMKQGIVTNPLKLDSFLRAVGSALTVDTGTVALSDLIFGLRNVTPKTLVGVHLPSYPQTIDGVSYVRADSSAPDLYQAIRDDTLEIWTAENPSWVNRL
jgi:LCP family protein required for cell wall assembly